MRYLRHAAVLLVLVMVTVLAAGCGGAKKVTEKKQESTAIEVTDMAGRKISLDKPAERIVALTAAECEILFAVGAGKTLVGRGQYCNYPEEVQKVPSVQSGAETNLEQIMSLNPQVVLMTKMAQSKEQVDALEKAGIKVVVTDAQNIEGVYEAIGLIGSIVGKDKEAAEVIDGMKETFAEISSKLQEKASGDKKTIYFEVSPLKYGLWTAGKGTFMDELATLLDMENAFADVNGWAEVSQEQVIQRNPDYIVTTEVYSGSGPTPVEEILGRDGWQDMKAIKNRAILNVDPDQISRPAPRLADVARTIYSFIYENKAR